MKRVWELLFFAVFGVLSVACGEQELERAFLKLETTNLEFEAVGAAVQTVAVTSNVDWDCTMSDESMAWISVEKRTGGVAVAVADNSGVESRSGAVTLVPASPDLEPKRITVVQSGSSYTLSVEPASLSFAGEDAPAQEIAVTVGGGTLEWTVAADEACRSWVTVVRKEGTAVVTVADNPATEPRSGSVVISADVAGVGPKAVKVVQEGRVLQPSLGVDVRELQFGSRAEMLGQTVNVAAVAVDWKVVTSDTPDTSGNPVEWISIVSERDSYFIVNVETNATLEERSGYVVVTSGQDDVPDIAVAVTQEAGREFLSDLTGDAVMEDLPGGGGNLSVIPVDDWTDFRTTTWYMSLWGADLEYVKVSWPYSVGYYGSGSRLEMTIRSSVIYFNDDNEYWLPEGTYRVVTEDIYDENSREPFTVLAGSESNSVINPNGSWYYRLVEDEYVGSAPIVEGTVTVARNGEAYTLTFDFVDDAGYRITGTRTGALELKVASTPTPQPAS